jgi:FAD-dependent urate hydroxylase
MLHAIVIGAGATGKAAAVALAEAGCRVSLFDGRAEPGASGGALMMWSNAVKALHDLGIAPDQLVESGAVTMQRMDFRTFEGDLLWSMAINDLSARARAPSLLLDRGSLQQALQKRVGDLAIDVKPKTFWNFRTASGGVEAVFTDGTSETADLLVGAEGGTSRVRRRLFGPPRQRKTGQHVAFGYSKTRSEIAPVGACYCLMDADHRFFAAGLPATWPVSEKGVVWHTYWGASVPSSMVKEPDSRGRPFSLGDLRKAFHGAAPDVEHVLCGSEPDAPPEKPYWWAIESCDQPPGGPWHRGSVGLIGDAAHLMTYDLGQGQAMGLEDAVVLGDCARKHPGNPTATLAALEAARCYRVGVITELSYRAAQVSTPGSELLTWLRDLAIANFYAPVNERTMRYMLEVDLRRGVKACGAAAG